jgi:hypothetical protein
MTYEEIKETIEAGCKRAFKRRGPSGKLGITRTRLVPRVVYEEVEVSQPKTVEEIASNIRKGHIAAEERRRKAQEAKALAKEDAEEIKRRGYKIEYNLDPGQDITIAYKWDFMSGQTEVYFAWRSSKDTFSRKAARRALLKHMDAGTHKLTFRVGNPHRSRISAGTVTAILERVETHPQEFPSDLVSEIRSNDSTIRLMKTVGKFLMSGKTDKEFNAEMSKLTSLLK